MKKKILILEDEATLRDMLVVNLKMEGYQVIAVEKGNEAVNTFENEHFDLCILDVMTPNMNGFEVCEVIRYKNKDVPVIFTSARSATNDKLIGLRSGADDYITKPYHLEELLLKIRRILDKHEIISRTKSIQDPTMQFGEVSIDVETGQGFGPHGEVVLTKRELDVLRCLYEFDGQVVTRKKLYHIVWGFTLYPDTRTLDNFIMNLRKKVEPDPQHPKHLLSVRGAGYRFLKDGIRSMAS